jgi:hypothetical protein
MLAQFTKLLQHNYVSATLSLFLALYAALASPQLPDGIAKMFENAGFRMIIMALVVYMSSKKLDVAIMIAVAFTVTMNMLNEKNVAEGFVDGIKNNINEGFQSGGNPTPFPLEYYTEGN